MGIFNTMEDTMSLMSLEVLCSSASLINSMESSCKLEVVAV